MRPSSKNSAPKSGGPAERGNRSPLASSSSGLALLVLKAFMEPTFCLRLGAVPLGYSFGLDEVMECSSDWPLLS